jgi:hypothetical protein
MNSLILSTVILLVFTALTAGSYYHGDAVGMFNMLTAWRFFVSHLTPVYPATSDILDRSASVSAASIRREAWGAPSQRAGSSLGPGTHGSSCSPTP